MLAGLFYAFVPVLSGEVSSLIKSVSDFFPDSNIIQSINSVGDAKDAINEVSGGAPVAELVAGAKGFLDGVSGTFFGAVSFIFGGVGDEAFGEAVGRFGHFVAGHADFVRCAGLDDEEIVRGDVGIFENELHGGSGGDFELAQVVEQALGDGLDGDGLQAGLVVEGVRRLGLLLFRHEGGFGRLAVFEELCKHGMLLHEGGVAFPKRLQRVAVERGA